MICRILNNKNKTCCSNYKYGGIKINHFMCCKTSERESLWHCLITIIENIAMEFVPVWFVLNYRLISRNNFNTDFVASKGITNHTLSLKYGRFLLKHPV